MAYVDNPNQNQEEQVAGSTPLSTGAPAASESASQPSGGASTGSPIQGTTSGSNQATTTNKKKPASSGMFTNIQKYVEKNQPQAVNMAQAATENVTKQADSIRKATEQKQQEQQQVLAANQQKLEGAEQFAQQQVQQAITSPEQAVTQEDSQRFQDLMRGDAGVQGTQDLNIAEETNRARALSQLAGTANTEQGRQRLLGDTFKKQGDYSSGMSGLDQLITAGSEDARETMIQGTQEQAQNLQNTMRTIDSEANRAKATQDLAIKNFGTNIENLGVEAQQQIMNEVNVQLENQKGQLQSQLEDLRSSALEQFSSDLQFQDEESFWRDLADFRPITWDKGGDRTRLSQWSVERAGGLTDKDILDLSRERNRSLGKYSGFNTHYYGDERYNQNLMVDQETRDRMMSNLENLVQSASDYGLDPSKYQQQMKDLEGRDIMRRVYGWDGHQDGGDPDLYRYDLGQTQNIVKNLFSDIGSTREDVLSRQLANKYGLGQEGAGQFISGESFDPSGVATQQQADKMAALRNLMGKQTDALSTELGESADIGGDAALFEQLRKDLGLV